MLKGLIVQFTHHGARVQRRIAAILIALCLLIGIVGFSSVLSGAIGIRSGDSTPEPTDAPTGAQIPPGPATDDTGADPTPAATPPEYIEQDSTYTGGALPTQILDLVTTIPTPVLSATVRGSDEATTNPRTPRVTDKAEGIPLLAPGPEPVSVTIGAKHNTYYPSTITAQAGAHVTITFVNQDIGTFHNVAIFTDTSLTDPIFTGKMTLGSEQITYAFTAPLEPGEYVLGCCFPSPHRMGTFVVE